MGKQPQNAIAFQMPEAIVDLLETIQIADHDRQGCLVAFAASQFPIELQEERTGVGQAGEVIGDRGTLRLLVFQGVFDG
jgi:hypothetical protein